jgi:hypothetical protein
MEQGTKMIFGLGDLKPRAIRLEPPIEIIFTKEAALPTFGRVPQNISPRAEYKMKSKACCPACRVLAERD